MYIFLSLIMLLSVESFAMDDASEERSGSPEGRASITTAVTPQRPKKRNRVEVDASQPAVALGASDSDDDDSDDEVAGLLSPPVIVRTPWSAKNRANALKVGIRRVSGKIYPGFSDLLPPSPLISTSPDGRAFFLDADTLQGFEALLKMIDAVPFKPQIEELKIEFLKGKEMAK